MTELADPYGDGRKHLAEGRPGRAIERFQRALARDRNSVLTLNGLGIAYAELGRYLHAERYFERALDLAPNDGLTLNNYASMLIAKGEPARARPLLEAAARRVLPAERQVVDGNLAIAAARLAEPVVPPLTRVAEAAPAPLGQGREARPCGPCASTRSARPSVHRAPGRPRPRRQAPRRPGRCLRTPCWPRS